MTRMISRFLQPEVTVNGRNVVMVKGNGHSECKRSDLKEKIGKKLEEEEGFDVAHHHFYTILFPSSYLTI